MKSLRRILILGSNGLIGSACKKFLAGKAGSEVFAPLRRSLDLENREQVREYMVNNAISHVIFAAGKTGGIMENTVYPATLVDSNVVISLNTMWAANKAGVQKMIIFGSSCMYPQKAEQPYRENALFSGRVEPSSAPYAYAKMLCIQAALAYNKQYVSGTTFIPVIPNSTYGPNDNFDENSSHVLAALIARLHTAHTRGDSEVTIWGSGRPKREFVYSDDVASACDFLLNTNLSGVAFPINISTNEEICITDLAQLIADVIGFKGKILHDLQKPEGAMRKSLSTKRITSLGWSPSKSLREGIKHTYRWYCASA